MIRKNFVEIDGWVRHAPIISELGTIFFLLIRKKKIKERWMSERYPVVARWESAKKVKAFFENLPDEYSVTDDGRLEKPLLVRVRGGLTLSNKKIEECEFSHVMILVQEIEAIEEEKEKSDTEFS